MMRKGIAVFAAAAIIALAGCGASAVALDREVTVSGLTLSVPSTWVEDGNDYMDGEFGSRSYSTEGDDDEYGYINVSYSEPDADDPTPSEEMEDTAEFYTDELHADSFTFESVDETVIDGAECETFRSVETYEADGGEVETVRQHIFIRSFEKSYEITISGDMVDVDALMESISLD